MTIWEITRNDVEAAVRFYIAALERNDEDINEIAHVLYRLQDDPTALMERLAAMGT